MNKKIEYVLRNLNDYFELFQPVMRCNIPMHLATGQQYIKKNNPKLLPSYM